MDEILPPPASVARKSLEEFASRVFKIERRPPGDGAPAMYRIVWEDTRGKDRHVVKTEWMKRQSLYAHVARFWSKMRAFVFEGMGKVPVG